MTFALRRAIRLYVQARKKVTASVGSGLSADDEQTLRVFPLRDELHTIHDIVATTIRFVNIPRSEATWNDHVHGPILRLAVSNTLHVGAENITQGAVTKTFIPAARGELEILGGKMIDCALLFRPEQPLAARIVDFVDGFDGPQTFNQSRHGRFCYEPTGALVKTNVDIRRCAEGKAQLRIWLGAWPASRRCPWRMQRRRRHYPFPPSLAMRLEVVPTRT
ncbi:hypothetical protein RB597_010252 [Gaeumannomyces tritici]